MLDALVSAQETLRKGSKSFDVAKLAFGREMRIGLVAIYAWCRVTDNLIDEAADCKDSESPSRLDILQTIRKHLEQAYSCTNPARGASPSSSSPSVAEDILCSIPDLSEEDRSAFHLFAALIPRLVPIHPFRELCDGYETDLRFVPSPSPAPPPSTARSRDTNGNPEVDVNVNLTVGVLPTSPLVDLVQDPDFQLEEHLPIKTTRDLLDYADNVAGSIASAICYLSWSILTPSPTPSRPVDSLSWTTHTHTHVHVGGTDTGMTVPESESDPTPLVLRRMRIASHAREMGRALQLVNIARDIAKDARIGRVYVPLSSFSSAKDLLAVILPSSRSNPGPTHGSARESTRVDLDYAPYTLPLLEMADQMRSNSQHAMADLPRTARGGTRAMVASYFEIAEAIRRRGGAIDERGVRVDKWRRLLAAGTAMWFGMA
jgi:15-cis-phytoene synthase/lycopene beta-cyclase